MKIAHLTERAHLDLFEIWLHIAPFSIRAADRILDRIEQRCAEFAHRPNLARERSELGRDLRSFVVRPYVVFFRIAESGIEVLRIVHGHRDLPTLFDDDLAES